MFTHSLWSKNILSSTYLDTDEQSTLLFFKLPIIWNSAWDQIMQKTIANCFHESGFCHTEGDEENETCKKIVLTVDN